MNKGKRNISLALTLLLHANNHAMYNMLMPLETPLRGFFGFDRLAPVSLGFTLYLFLFGIGQIPIGFLSDRMSRKTLLGIGAVLNGIAIASVAIFPSYKMFLAGMTVAGIGAAAFHPVNASYISDLFRKSRGTALGLSGFGATAGLFFGQLTSGYICEAVGWKTTFLIFSAFSVFTGILFLLTAVEPDRGKSDGTAPGKQWSRGLVIFLAVAATIFTLREFAGWGGYSLVQRLGETIHGFSRGHAGYIASLQTVGGFVSQPLGGYLSDRFGRRILMIVLLFFCAFFLVMIPFTGKTFIIPAVLLYGICYTATVPIIDALIADRIPSNIRGGVFGIFMASGIGIAAFSPSVQALILDATGGEFRGFVLCFAMLGTCVILSMIVMLLFKGAEKKNA